MKPGTYNIGQPLPNQQPGNFTHSRKNKLPKQEFHKRAKAFQLPLLLVTTRIIFIYLLHQKECSCGNSITQIVCLPSLSLSFNYVTCLRKYMTSNHLMYFANILYYNATQATWQQRLQIHFSMPLASNHVSSSLLQNHMFFPVTLHRSLIWQTYSHGKLIILYTHSCFNPALSVEVCWTSIYHRRISLILSVLSYRLPHSRRDTEKWILCRV